MNAERLIDQIALKQALEDLSGMAVLLLDASRHQDPEQEGITTAARILESIHTRIETAVGFAEAGR